MLKEIPPVRFAKVRQAAAGMLKHDSGKQAN
jgi:hypothetical protein